MADPKKFPRELTGKYPILKSFHYDTLPAEQRAEGERFFDEAQRVLDMTPPGEARWTALFKLLEDRSSKIPE